MVMNVSLPQTTMGLEIEVAPSSFQVKIEYDENHSHGSESLAAFRAFRNRPYL